MLIEEFIEASNEAQSEGEVFQLLEKELAAFGFDRVLYSLLTDHPSIDKKAGHGILRNYPGDWMEYYTSKGYENVDPVRKIACIAPKPFLWSQIDKFYTLSKAEKKVMDEAEEATLKNGMAIPLYGPAGEVAGVGLASSSGGVELSLKDVSTINTLCHQFHLVFSSLGYTSRDPRPLIHLTLREKEVLVWSARGKSSWTIGEILSISEDTVEFHLKNTFAKLNVTTRVLAVVKAIHLGLISP